jgi:hypothetical protein
MIVLLVSFVFAPEFFELLNDLVIFADLLVDGKQHGIEREHDSQQITSRIKPEITPDIRVIEEQGKHLIVVTVPEGASKP